MTATQDKFVLKSKTVWGVILMVAPTLLGLVGVQFPEDMANDLDQIIVGAIEVIGMALALWGRWNATTSLTVLP